MMCFPIIVRIAATTATAATAIAAACAYAGTGSATASAAFATGASNCRYIISATGVAAASAVAAVGSITASGIDGAPTEEVERVAFSKFNTCTSTSLSAGIGSCAGKRRT